jgi:hypothetical protein
MGWLKALREWLWPRIIEDLPVLTEQEARDRVRPLGCVEVATIEPPVQP